MTSCLGWTGLSFPEAVVLAVLIAAIAWVVVEYVTTYHGPQ